MKFPFTIKASNWYDYLNPRWWQRKKRLEKVLSYVWDTQNLELRFSDAIHDATLYGEGRALIELVKK